MNNTQAKISENKSALALKQTCFDLGVGSDLLGEEDFAKSRHGSDTDRIREEYHRWAEPCEVVLTRAKEAAKKFGFPDWYIITSLRYPSEKGSVRSAIADKWGKSIAEYYTLGSLIWKVAKEPEMRGYFEALNDFLIEVRLTDDHLIAVISSWVSSYDEHTRPEPEEVRSFIDHFREALIGYLEKPTPEGFTSYSQNAHSQPIDVTAATFDVALSFPGENRPYARAVADRLSQVLGRNGIFYDEYYKSQLARPNLDILLQDIFRNRSRLIVVFLCEAYQSKDWCGIEFKAIREILKQREDAKVMYVRCDEGNVDGVFSTDGYIDAKKHTPIEVAELIVERVRLKAKWEHA